MLTLLFLTLASASPESEDLPAMAKKYGWATVASVVHSSAASDRSLSEIHANLRELGLHRLELPLNVDPGLKALRDVGPITACGWNQGVACRLDLPAGSPKKNLFEARCRRGETDLELRLPLVFDPAPTPDSAGVAHLQDLLPCWDAGGDNVRLVPVPPQGPTLRVEGMSSAEARVLLQPFAEALEACAGEPPRELRITDAGERPSVLVFVGEAEHVQGTACAQRALSELRAVPDGALIYLSLPLPW
ncbi:MAG: hypothetical protein EA397_00380 [Deltaproteobacteria bacterium]|nr:MAG: hypothetical protein EA397_00380 [Deltaproteobacteria bacterium]